MEVQILTPTKTIFSGNVESFYVPGTNGEFQILKNHEAIVSTLEVGKIKLNLSNPNIKLSDFTEENHLQIYPIKGGIIEFNNNRGIILCD